MKLPIKHEVELKLKTRTEVFLRSRSKNFSSHLIKNFSSLSDRSFGAKMKSFFAYREVGDLLKLKIFCLIKRDQMILLENIEKF